MIVYYIGGPADRVRQSLSRSDIPTCLTYTMMQRDQTIRKHFYRLVARLNIMDAWVYEYDPSIEEVQ